MLCSFGYDVERCFDCPYGNGSHIPEDFEGWTCSVIKDTMVKEIPTLVLSLNVLLCHIYVSLKVPLLSVSAVLRGDHGLLPETPVRSRGSHSAGLCGSRDPVLQTEGDSDGAEAVAGYLQNAR